MTVSKEVEECFKENPHLITKSLKEIAQFFMVQGELRYSLLRQTLNHKADFFLNRLFDADEEFARKCLREWKEVSNMYEPPKKSHLGEVDE